MGVGGWGAYACDLLTKDVEGDGPHASPHFISGHAGVLSRHAGLPDQQGADGLRRGTSRPNLFNNSSCGIQLLNNIHLIVDRSIKVNHLMINESID